MPQEPTPLDLDEAWASALAEAEAQARASGRADITQYLQLRTSNDFIRKTACDWLFAVFRNVAAELNREGASLQISSEDNYEFNHDTTVLAGRLLRLENGVRQLLVEVGWPRIPKHGFIRGGGLALGNVRHAGIKSANDQLRLMISAEGTPAWMVNRPSQSYQFDESHVRKHLNILIDYTRTD